jgi:hypothetical protein
MPLRRCHRQHPPAEGWALPQSSRNCMPPSTCHLPGPSPTGVSPLNVADSNVERLPPESNTSKGSMNVCAVQFVWIFYPTKLSSVSFLAKKLTLTSFSLRAVKIHHKHPKGRQQTQSKIFKMLRLFSQRFFSLASIFIFSKKLSKKSLSLKLEKNFTQ